jgi:preprotein translocase subunit SecD
MSINAPDSSKAMTLIQASEHMVTRRLAAASVQDPRVAAIPEGTGSAVLTLKLSNADAVQAAERILAEPFSFDIRLEKEKKAPADNTEQSEWIPTNLTGTDIEWVEAVRDSEGNVAVELRFTTAGRAALSSIFSANKGKNAGIFVRDLLVSKLKIPSEAMGDHVIISGIPSAKVAEIFADDVNVGLRVSFSPIH